MSRGLLLGGAVAGALGLSLVPPATAQPYREGTSQADSARAVRIELGERLPKDLRGFYAARGNRPLWFDDQGKTSPGAAVLVGYLQSADLDGLRPRTFKVDSIARALKRAATERSAERIAAAELQLSQGFVRYVQALRQTPRGVMIFEGAALAPVVPTPAAALQLLASEASIEGQLRIMAWMHPFYAPLRQAVASRQVSPVAVERARLSLARLRAIPSYASERWVMVDSAGARIWMFEGRRVIDSMKVVVGTPHTPTPIMAGFLRQAVINPYWNLPDDLVPSRIVAKVLSGGPDFLAANRYQLVDGWDNGAKILDPRRVDWNALAANRNGLRVRQLPGAGNFMGQVKYTFPNPHGIYLHDTPERGLLTKRARHFSNGCVRLEDARRFGRWLLGKPLPRIRTPETGIDLPVPVPIYLTYLTAIAENGRVTLHPDVYGRDIPNS